MTPAAGRQKRIIEGWSALFFPAGVSVRIPTEISTECATTEIQMWQNIMQ